MITGRRRNGHLKVMFAREMGHPKFSTFEMEKFCSVETVRTKDNKNTIKQRKTKKRIANSNGII